MTAAEQNRRCRRCLLRDMAEQNDYYRSVQRYRASLAGTIRTPDDTYEQRLKSCQACAALVNGTCMQCGCYVEMRAARIDMHCPMEIW